MGMRIHKSIGYGINLFPAKYSREYDSRYEELENITMDQFFDWIIEHQDEIQRYTKVTNLNRTLDLQSIEEDRHKYKDLSLVDLIEHDPEFGNKKVVLFYTPFEYKIWRRYDDPIDWAEERSAEHFKPTYTKLKVGVYPYQFRLPPFIIGGLLIYLGWKDLWPKLEEALYTYWS